MIEMIQDSSCLVDKVTIISFCSAFCVPCKAMEPGIRKAAEQFADDVRVVKCDVDEHPDIAAKYDIDRVPAMVFVRGEEVLKTLTGPVSTFTILESIEDVI